VRAAALGRVRLPCYYLVAPAEASSNLARYDGVRYGLRVGDGDYREMVDAHARRRLRRRAEARIMLGTYALSAGYYDAYYGTGAEGADDHRREHAAAFERFDVLVCPTSPTVAFELGARRANPLAMYASDLLTIPSCMAGLPGLNVPCGLSEGLPVGLPADRPAVRREHALPRGHALERRIGFDVVPERLR
jgi:aspartyl-tRNA(Asn)/glutamyl-tRNA(Gln) amidotransferase subunit A